MQKPLYLDYCATTPTDPRVVEAMLPWFYENPGNASSKNHVFGWRAESAVENAREQMSRLIGTTPHEITFTSGATESINLAIKGIYQAYSNKGNHIITCATEHKAVLDTCKQLEQFGAKITYLPVNKTGQIDLNQLDTSISDSTILVSIMMANNETGVIQPISQIAEIAHRHGIAFMSDATQAIGEIPVNVDEMGIDIMAFSAHKFYGPKGVGGLFLKKQPSRIAIAPQQVGGGQERGLRSGTLNVPGIVGLGKAAELCFEEMQGEQIRLRDIQQILETELKSSFQAAINGEAALRLPNVSNVYFPTLRVESLLSAISEKIAVSTGSACNSATSEPSHVLTAMGLSKKRITNSLRFSWGRFTTIKEIQRAIATIGETISRL